MPDKKESYYPEDWFGKADKDFKRARKNLDEEDFEESAFHLQQALEKYLKGALLYIGWKLKRVHDLEYLLDELIKSYPDLERFRVLCQELTGYYFIERYPFITEEPSRIDLRSNLKESAILINKLRSVVK